MELKTNIDTSNLQIFKREIVMNLQKNIGNNVLYNEDLKFLLTNFCNMLMGETFKSLNPETKEIIESKGIKGVYLAGGIGSGKTTALKAILQTLNELNVKFEGEDKFYVGRNFYYNINTLEKYFVDSGKFPESFIMYIDDLPAENKIFNFYGNKSDLNSFFFEKYDTKGILFISSNFPMTKKYLQYDERVLSRFKEMFVYYELKNKDLRK